MSFTDALTPSERFFHTVTARPATALVAALIAIVISASGLARLVKDTSLQAFIPVGHPSLLTDRNAEEVFGLSDPIAIALITRDGRSVFTPDTLALIDELSNTIAELPNVRADRVTSLATESSIRGDDGAVMVERYIDAESLTDADVRASLSRWEIMPPHQGTLVSDDGRGAIIMAELIDVDRAPETYDAVSAKIAAVQREDLELHVAGPGAVSGYLSEYIDRDARRLQPLVFLLVLGFIYLAFRRAAAMPGPLLVVLGAAGGALGLMAFNGTPYFAITNALPVILVAISVADAIHILSAYFQLRAEYPGAPVRDLVIRAMSAMVRPITLTTLTTIAGFTGIAAVSVMPPITAFAWYAAIGVALAWVYSMLALPNMIILIKLGPSPAFANWERHQPSGLGRFLAHIGGFSAARYHLVLTMFAAATLAFGLGAAQLRIDRSQVDNFAVDEPIRLADERMNEVFAGTAFLDVMIQADSVDGLLNAHYMHKIAELQAFMETLPHVRKTMAITDYLSLLHTAIQGKAVEGAGRRPLPGSDDAIAQYLLVYEASGDPADFEEEIDYDYQRALVRAVLDEHYFSENRRTVMVLNDYLDQTFNEPGLRAALSGDVNVSYHWMTSLEETHFIGVGLSLLLVFLTAVVVFRSPADGLIAVVPVLFAVLVLYGTMGWLGIYLEPATSMFAAIALGVGVDFGIHLVDRLRAALAESEGVGKAVDRALPATARACFFNSAALALGFSVLLVSNLPTLQRFGGLVAAAAVASYLAALVIVPALFAAVRACQHSAWFKRRPTAGVGTCVIGLIAWGLAASDARGEDAAAGVAANVIRACVVGEDANDEQAAWVSANVSARIEGAATRRVISMVLKNQRGRTQERTALVLKQNGEDARLTRISYLEPKGVRNVSFLSHDFQSAEATDDRWLYLPAARKVRRVPASARGDYFLGTDFTYEDIQSELKFDPRDYQFEYLGVQSEDGAVQHRLKGVPKDKRTVRELGYGGFDALIDETTWMPVTVRFFDPKCEPLKTIRVEGIRAVDGIWTATRIMAINHQTRHETLFTYQDVDYLAELPAAVFDAPGLSRGLPPSLAE
jgi:predicted RND superfamily exporter protein